MIAAKTVEIPAKQHHKLHARLLNDSRLLFVKFLMVIYSFYDFSFFFYVIPVIDAFFMFLPNFHWLIHI